MDPLATKYRVAYSPRQPFQTRSSVIIVWRSPSDPTSTTRASLFDEKFAFHNSTVVVHAAARIW